MPLKSYLVHPMEGRREELITSLNNVLFCEVLSSDNYDVLILITDTPDEKSEKILEEKLLSVESIKFLSLVSGYEEESAIEFKGEVV